MSRKCGSTRSGSALRRQARACCGCMASSRRRKRRWCIRAWRYRNWRRRRLRCWSLHCTCATTRTRRRLIGKRRMRSWLRCCNRLPVCKRGLRDSLSGARAKHATLTQVLNDRSYTADAVQKLFAANERGGGHDFHAVGVLADYAEVEQQHEAAIEQYLRDELEYVVVQTYDHARAGVTLLRDEVGGRATFFVDSLRSLNVRLDEYEPIVNFRTQDGVVSRLDKLVEFRDPLGPAAKQFLPRLKAAYLTDGPIAAEKLARDNPQ